MVILSIKFHTHHFLNTAIIFSLAFLLLFQLQVYLVPGRQLNVQKSHWRATGVEKITANRVGRVDVITDAFRLCTSEMLNFSFSFFPFMISNGLKKFKSGGRRGRNVHVPMATHDENRLLQLLSIGATSEENIWKLIRRQKGEKTEPQPTRNTSNETTRNLYFFLAFGFFFVLFVFCGQWGESFFYKVRDYKVGE